MSIQSEAAKAHIVFLLDDEYGTEDQFWVKEYQFHPERKWRFDFAVPSAKVAIELDGGTFQSVRTGHSSGVGLRAWREKNNAAMTLGWRVWHYAPEEVIRAGRKRHRGQEWSEAANKLNSHALLCDCVTLPDEPVLQKLPWL